MEVDFAAITEYQRYKLMASLIVPRPIALVTTLGPDGTANAAPFSMFNMLGEEPPIVMISVNRLGNGAQKDTAANIDRTGEFVVHLSDEAMAEKMHRCGERLPPDVSELAHVGLTAAPSTSVAPPRIAEAPVAFECRLWETLATESRQIFIGRVLRLHARDGLIDTETWRVRLQEYFPVGRFGASFYVTTRDRFSLEQSAGKPAVSTAIDEM
ncbi:flavin reductase family protein [Cupriavidus plantarum]|uniref:Flavin reductase (DIM6/NTAB) family NADH-FMN oxidoreductase RutF n=1 Tax=Cupriavidus plantarum TaxID=942865 RepID=A0A316ET02_9BURK|nr:flavin reductase family protein [Cupriavidus plantarum]PWK35126.1 flavin reductase (DIM6/NTAB) family NADH-FMN oxidoreductase RutF [Cupriavidus plantarum]